MKPIWGVLIISILVLAGRQGYKLLRKIKHAQRLTTSVQSFQLPKDFHLKNLIQDIDATLTIAIQNFSNSSFLVNQLNLQIESTAGQLIASQSRPLSNPVSIKPNEVNPITIQIKLTPQQVRTLIGLAGGLAKVAGNWLSTGKYGIPLLVKGFVEIDGVSIDLNQTLSI